MKDDFPFTLPENKLAPTPGKWWQERYELSSPAVRGGEGLGYPVATAYGNPQTTDAARAAEAASNARLIAGAPELLAAAKGLVAVLDELMNSGPMTNGKVSQACAILGGTIIQIEDGPHYYDDDD